MLREFVRLLEGGTALRVGLAIAVIIGGKLNELVSSMVSDLLMPLLLQPALRAANVDDIREAQRGRRPVREGHRDDHRLPDRGSAGLRLLPPGWC